MDFPSIFIYIKDPDELAACISAFNDFYEGTDEGRGARNLAWLNFQHAWMDGSKYASEKASDMKDALVEAETYLRSVMAIEPNDVANNVFNTIMAALAKAGGAQ